MGELKPDVDLQALNEWFADIPPGPYDALNTTGGWEVRQIDTDPANKHHWPFRLCSSITGQTAGCDAAVFSFIAGVINAWPHLLDAARTEGRGEGEPVAWQEAAEPFFRLAREVINPVNGERPWHADSKDWMVVFSFAGQSVTLGDLRRAAYASPIREPEISREALIKLLADHFGFRPHEQMAEDKSDLRGKIRDGYDVNEPTKSDLAEAADAILNLATVGGRGEGWRPISEAPRDGSYILAHVADRDADDRWAHLAGRAFVVRHEGKTSSGYDLGWSVHPGFGGCADDWFSGWQPLPPRAGDLRR